MSSWFRSTPDTYFLLCDASSTWSASFECFTRCNQQTQLYNSWLHGVEVSVVRNKIAVTLNLAGVVLQYVQICYIHHTVSRESLFSRHCVGSGSAVNAVFPDFVKVPDKILDKRLLIKLRSHVIRITISIGAIVVVAQVTIHRDYYQWNNKHKHTHTRLTALFPGLPR